MNKRFRAHPYMWSVSHLLDPSFICSVCFSLSRTDNKRKTLIRLQAARTKHVSNVFLYEANADMDEELLARLVNFIRGLYMVSKVPPEEPLSDEVLTATPALAAQR